MPAGNKPKFAVTLRVSSALARRCDSWNLELDKLSFPKNGESTAKTNSLRGVRDTYERTSKKYFLVACQAKLRWLGSLELEVGPSRFRSVTLINESPLLVHLGRANVLENVGLYVDRVTGLPWIPGTTLKGVVSMWAFWEGYFGRNGTLDEIRMPLRPGGSAGEATPLTRGWIAQHGPEKSDLASRILGDDSASGSESAGDVVFVGGFPTTPPILSLDIVNPHHEPDGTPKRNLTPNTFLTLEPGTAWLFVFYSRAGAVIVDMLLDETARWAKEAMTELGLGAKTAAGYGRFRELTQNDLKKEEIEKVERKEQAQRAVEHAKALETLKSDYPNEASFKNSVLRPAGSPGQWDALQREVEKLKKPENAQWLERFKAATAGRDYRKLRSQPWYPK
jgi:CRISPR type III-B/RAMP module RAMP protein Cmr6